MLQDIELKFHNLLAEKVVTIRQHDRTERGCIGSAIRVT